MKHSLLLRNIYLRMNTPRDRLTNVRFLHFMLGRAAWHYFARGGHKKENVFKTWFENCCLKNTCMDEAALTAR